jgi:nucleotidyltransferase/DNA polymerase involved in DNA repair
MSVSAQCVQLPTGAIAKRSAAAISPDETHGHRAAAAYVDLQRELGDIRRQTVMRTGRRISIAAARTAIVARTASRLLATANSAGDALSSTDLPEDSVRVVPAGGERAFLAPLPLQHLYGVAPNSLRRLRASGLVTIGQLQRVPKATLQAAFGPCEGLRLWRSARGIDSLPASARPGFRGWLASRLGGARRLSAFGALSAPAGTGRIRGLFANVLRGLL